MALRSARTAIAIKTQSAVGTYTDPSANLMTCSNVRLDFPQISAPNPEYTGTVERNGDAILGKSATLSYDINLRGPGGASVPAAGAFLLGQLFVSAKMAEVRVATAVPASAEALSTGTTTGFTGGAGMAATKDLYRGMLVDLPARGAKPKALSPIRTNSAAKVVELSETLAANASGNYQIPAQLMYQSTLSASDPLPLSQDVWRDGVRYQLVDMVCTGCTIAVQTTTRNQGAIPVAQFQFTGRLFAYVDEATPSIQTPGATPTFRDADCWLAKKKIGATSFNLQRAITTSAGDNPNQPDGSDVEEIDSIQTTVALDMQQYRVAVFDNIAMADAQAYYDFWAMWGLTSGQTVSVLVADARLGYAAPQDGQGVVKVNPTLYVDAMDKAVTISFPYWV